MVGIQLLSALPFWIKTKCLHRQHVIPKVSPERVAPVVRWIREHAATLGALPSPAIKPLGDASLSAVPSIGIVPWERFKPPSERSGYTGANRAPV